MTDRVLVTGGALNIGAAIAARCKAEGYVVTVFDQVEPAAGTADDYVAVDLLDAEATQAAMKKVASDGTVTRLVNNVGVVKPAWLEDQTVVEFETVMALNVRCAMLCTQAVVPAMRAQRFGRIVSISSRAALGKTLRTAYAASKAALLGMTRTWALELAKDGITVNAVAPGSIATSAFFSNNPPEDPRTQAIIAAIPVGRIGTPEDVAQAVSFFLDARSSFVTGQTLYVCGGLTVGLSA